WVLKCWVRYSMRAVRRATWTSGEPVSSASLPYFSTMDRLSCAVSAMGVSSSDRRSCRPRGDVRSRGSWLPTSRRGRQGTRGPPPTSLDKGVPSRGVGLFGRENLDQAGSAEGALGDRDDVEAADDEVAGAHGEPGGRRGGGPARADAARVAGAHVDEGQVR